MLKQWTFKYFILKIFFVDLSLMKPGSHLWCSLTSLNSKVPPRSCWAAAQGGGWENEKFQVRESYNAWKCHLLNKLHTWKCRNPFYCFLSPVAYKSVINIFKCFQTYKQWDRLTFKSIGKTFSFFNRDLYSDKSVIDKYYIVHKVKKKLLLSVITLSLK